MANANSRQKQLQNRRNIYQGMDELILFACLALVLIGIVMVFSASYYNEAIKGESPYTYLKKQSIYAFIGFIGMMFASRFNYKLFRGKIGPIAIPVLLYLSSFLLMIYTMLFGISKGGATRWVSIAGFNFQPSEIAKVAIILIVPYIVYYNKKILDDLKGIIIVSIVVLLMAGVVGIENLSTGIIICLIGFGTMFIASKKTGFFIFIGIVAVIGMLGYLIVASKIGGEFRGARFNAWLDPFAYSVGTGFQIVQSLYAIASGGFFGLGLGNSRQKLSYIPEGHNDIIFAIICEELGLFGAAIILFIFAIIIWRGFKIAMECPDIFGSLIATGITIFIASQVIINVAVVTNTIPNTGIPMPFISSGGTALIIAMGLVGILLNISRSCDYKKR